MANNVRIAYNVVFNAVRSEGHIWEVPGVHFGGILVAAGSFLRISARAGGDEGALGHEAVRSLSINHICERFWWPRGAKTLSDNKVSGGGPPLRGDPPPPRPSYQERSLKRSFQHMLECKREEQERKEEERREGEEVAELKGEHTGRERSVQRQIRKVKVERLAE